MLIICLLFMICGCKKEEKETIVDKIAQKDNLVFEYANKIKLYDLINTEEKLISDNNYIDTYKLGNNEVNIDYLNSKNKKKKYKVTYEIKVIMLTLLIKQYALITTIKNLIAILKEITILIKLVNII